MSSIQRSATTQLDSLGAGVATIQPGINETWKIETATVSVSSANTEATCAIYIGGEISNLNLRSTTFTGSSGDTDDSVGGTVKVPDKIMAVWTGGDPNALATLSITGDQK